jgi:hypothetical protein
MDLTVHIPDDIAPRLQAAGGDLSRRALEALALEEYKPGISPSPNSGACSASIHATSSTASSRPMIFTKVIRWKR